MLEFTTDCRLCPRLASFLDEVRVAQPDYFARPVPSFGDDQARFLIVGLAPGMHGANRTGRPFTGDHAGVLLFETLAKFGLAAGHYDPNGRDEFALTGAAIVNAVSLRCPSLSPCANHLPSGDGYRPKRSVCASLVS